MTTYLAFLRAVNLGATRVFPKDDIRRVTESAGFTGVATHINTGNVRFDSSMRSRPRIEEKLEAAFLADRGFEVPTIVFSAQEFRELAREAAVVHDSRPNLVRHYVYLLKNELEAATAATVSATASEAGEMVIRGRAVHALLGPKYEAGVVDPLGAAKLLGTATNRNVTVIAALAQKWCS